MAFDLIAIHACNGVVSNDGIPKTGYWAYYACPLHLFLQSMNNIQFNSILMKAKMMTVILVVGTLVGAQAQKNSLLVYGNAGYTSTNAENYASAYSFRPGIGYQFADHLTAGANVGAWGSKTERCTTGFGLYSPPPYFPGRPILRSTQPLGSALTV